LYENEKIALISRMNNAKEDLRIAEEIGKKLQNEYAEKMAASRA
jgi:hypothetical protein